MSQSCLQGGTYLAALSGAAECIVIQYRRFRALSRKPRPQRMRGLGWESRRAAIAAEKKPAGGAEGPRSEPGPSDCDTRYDSAAPRPLAGGPPVVRCLVPLEACHHLTAVLAPVVLGRHHEARTAHQLRSQPR